MAKSDPTDRLIKTEVRKFLKLRLRVLKKLPEAKQRLKMAEDTEDWCVLHWERDTRGETESWTLRLEGESNESEVPIYIGLQDILWGCMHKKPYVDTKTGIRASMKAAGRDDPWRSRWSMTIRVQRVQRQKP